MCRNGRVRLPGRALHAGRNLFLDGATDLSSDIFIVALISTSSEDFAAASRWGKCASTWVLMAHIFSVFGTLASNPNWHEVKLKSGRRL